MDRRADVNPTVYYDANIFRLIPDSSDPFPTSGLCMCVCWGAPKARESAGGERRAKRVFRRRRKRFCVAKFTSSSGSGVATAGQGGQSAPLTKKIAENREKEGALCPPLTKKLPKIGKKRGKSGKKWEKEEKSGRFFHFVPPDRYGWLRYCHQEGGYTQIES